MALPRPVSLCSYTALRVMPFPHERLCRSSTRLNQHAVLLCSLSPPFELHAKFRHAFLPAHHMLLSGPPEPLPPISSPKVTLRGKRSSPICATNPAHNIFRFRTLASMLYVPLHVMALLWDCHGTSHGNGSFAYGMFYGTSHGTSHRMVMAH